MPAEVMRMSGVGAPKPASCASLSDACLKVAREKQISQGPDMASDPEGADMASDPDGLDVVVSEPEGALPLSDGMSGET